MITTRRYFVILASSCSSSSSSSSVCVINDRDVKKYNVAFTPTTTAPRRSVYIVKKKGEESLGHSMRSVIAKIMGRNTPLCILYTNARLSPMRTGDEALAEAIAWSEANDTLGEPLRMRIGDAARWMNRAEPIARVVRGDGVVLWDSGVHGARFERFGGGGGGARAIADDDAAAANEDMDANDIEEACKGLSDATRVIALSNGRAVVKRLGDIQAGELLAANLSAGGEVTRWCQVLALKREITETAIVGSLMHIDDADEVLSVVVGVNATFNITAPVQRRYVEDVTAYATPVQVINWQFQDGGMQPQYDRLVLRAALSSAASEAEAIECVITWCAQNPHIEAPRVHNTRHALVVMVNGVEVWRVKYGARHFGARYVDTLDELNARVAAMNHSPAHLASAAEVLARDSETRSMFENAVMRYDAAVPNARVALSHDVDMFSVGHEGFSKRLFASIEIAPARFAGEFPDAPTFEALWASIDVEGVVPAADVARFVTMWLGDGCKRTLQMAVATEEKKIIGGFIANLGDATKFLSTSARLAVLAILCGQ